MSTTSRAQTRPRLRLPLRWRIAIAFAVVSLAVTGLLAAVTWHLAANFLVAKREQAVTSQAAVDARLVQGAVHTPRADGSGLGIDASTDDTEGTEGTEGTDTGTGPAVDPATGVYAGAEAGRADDLLTGLAGGRDITIAIRHDGGWTTSGRTLDVAALPDELMQTAGAGTPARQRISVKGMPVLAIALPLPERAIYVELVPLADLDATLRFLSIAFAVGVAVSGLLGLALGGWAGQRALRPLTELRDAAARVAAGDLDARLPEQRDTDLAPLATTFNRTAEDLQRRVRRDARFAGDVSHELRSPLTTLINAVAVLRRRRAELPSTAQQAVDLLDADIHRFQKMVTDLLEISRDETLDERDLEWCDLADLVCHALIGHSGISVDIADDLPLLLLDRRRLDRVIANLLDNADNYAGGAVRVAVSADAARTRIEVDDAGPGIPAELRTEVFERFARGGTAGQREDSGGTGLGLALVARHVRAHHGRIWIEDSPAGGARVVVELPLNLHR